MESIKNYIRTKQLRILKLPSSPRKIEEGEVRKVK